MLALTVFSTLVTFGCGGGGGGDSPTAPPVPGGAPTTLNQIQTQMFTPTCARVGCHDNSSAQAGLVLIAGLARANIVNVASSQQPALSRVEPGNAEMSYLLRKVRGDANITGARMPISGAALSQAQIDGIIQWIDSGAADN
jgi:hypothetical protein